MTGTHDLRTGRQSRTISRGTRRLTRKATGTAPSVLIPPVAGNNRIKVTPPEQLERWLQIQQF